MKFNVTSLRIKILSTSPLKFHTIKKKFFYCLNYSRAIISSTIETRPMHTSVIATNDDSVRYRFIPLYREHARLTATYTPRIIPPSLRVVQRNRSRTHAPIRNSSTMKMYNELNSHERGVLSGA